MYPFYFWKALAAVEDCILSRHRFLGGRCRKSIWKNIGNVKLATDSCLVFVSLCAIWHSEMQRDLSWQYLYCRKSNCAVLCCEVSGVICVCVVLKPRRAHPADEYEWAVQLIANPSHAHPHRPHPEAHHSVLSHSVTHDNQERDYGDQINYSLIQNAMVLTTLNPALPEHWRRLIALILLLYTAESPRPTWLRLSQERGSGLSFISLLIAFYIYDDRASIQGKNATLLCYFSISNYLQCFSYSCSYVV